MKNKFHVKSNNNNYYFERYNLVVDYECKYHSFIQSCHAFFKMTEQYKACCSSTVSVQDSSGSSLVRYVSLWRQLWKACSTFKVPNIMLTKSTFFVVSGVSCLKIHRYSKQLHKIVDGFIQSCCGLAPQGCLICRLKKKRYCTSLRQNLHFHFSLNLVKNLCWS